MRDGDQQEARRVLAQDAQGLVTLFDRPARHRLNARILGALDHCRDYRAALRRHQAHRREDVLTSPPLFQQVDRLITDLDGARGGTGP